MNAPPTLLRLAALDFVIQLAHSLHAAETSGTPEAMRLLKSNCFSCHNDQKKKGGLVMTSRDILLKGGDNGPALDLHAPQKTALLKSLTAAAYPHMPPTKQPSRQQMEA